MDAQHYLVTLQSGRTFVLKSGYDVYETAYQAYDEACLMDDYLVNVEPVDKPEYLTFKEEMEILATL